EPSSGHCASGSPPRRHRRRPLRLCPARLRPVRRRCPHFATAPDPAMRVVPAAEVDAALSHAGLVETLRDAFRVGAVQPVRHHHTIVRPDGADTTLLLMPAWSDFARTGTSDEGFIGV